VSISAPDEDPRRSLWSSSRRRRETRYRAFDLHSGNPPAKTFWQSGFPAVRRAGLTARCRVDGATDGVLGATAGKLSAATAHGPRKVRLYGALPNTPLTGIPVTAWAVLAIRRMRRDHRPPVRGAQTLARLQSLRKHPHPADATRASLIAFQTRRRPKPSRLARALQTGRPARPSVYSCRGRPNGGISRLWAGEETNGSAGALLAPGRNIKHVM